MCKYVATRKGGLPLHMYATAGKLDPSLFGHVHVKASLGGKREGFLICQTTAGFEHGPGIKHNAKPYLTCDHTLLLKVLNSTMFTGVPKQYAKFKTCLWSLTTDSMIMQSSK